MITQHYKIKASPENLKNARTGQFVYEDDDSDEITGFVDFVSDCDLALILFKPANITGFKFVNIAKTVDWHARLLEIWEEDPEVKAVWEEVIGIDNLHEQEGY